MARFIEVMTPKKCTGLKMLDPQTPYFALMNENHEVVLFDSDNEVFTTDKYDLERNGCIVNVL